MVAPAIHQNNKQLLQGIQHLINIDWSIQSLFMFQVLPIDIYNIAKRPYKKSTNTTVNLDELTDQEPQQTSNSHTRNEQLSGDCLILGITYTYFRKLTKSKESRLRQKLKVFKI
ncbi:hypothetical protein HYO65_gp247 [Tenacibaculum phage PTm1]|uniref:Uncharacterized protein n=2 Tax=Shirahamavirus PTm1 TaxID=2846435 RepID=A0A5S9HXN8_9CAUD|nr:hypothetical protein HYO65_gp247 [Tenacibaculum phage PTm1]BBI90639.1 hypothetical protein [Tenacibaculum phage PTm1]BBI90946.1 hypothetical protein [Tenacibaculum phage PTm5]